MPEESISQSPDVLREIQSAEQEVERLIRAAEHEAAATLDKARSQAEALLVERRRSCEQKNHAALSQGLSDAEREAEQLIKNAQAQVAELKARCMARMDEAVELVLQRVFPSSLEGQSLSGRPSSISPRSESELCR